MGKASSKDDQPSSGSSSSSDAGPEASTAPTAGEPLRICVAHTKASVCCLCQAKSTDPTPLAEPDPAGWGVIPWGKYRKLRVDDEMVRVPEGRIDMVCFNVFRALGCSSFGIFSGVRSANNFFNPKSPSLWP